MKSKTLLKLLLDLAMSVLYLMLMFSRKTGAFFHEAVGTGIILLFAAPLRLNRNMTRGLWASVRRGTAKTDRKLCLISDFALALGMPVAILTGILISRELFHLDRYVYGRMPLLYSVHKISSFVCLGALAAHVLLHAGYLLFRLLRNLKRLRMRELRTVLFRFAACASALVLLYAAAHLALHDRETVIPHRSDAPGAIHEDASKPLSGARGDFPASDGHDAPQAAETLLAPEATATPPTLEAYLSAQTCTGCSRQCSLLYPSCRKGEARQAQAAEEYARIYGADKEQSMQTSE